MTKPLVLVPVYRDLTPEDRVGIDARTRHLSRYDTEWFGPNVRPPSWVETPASYWTRRGYSPLMASRGLYQQIADRGYSHVLLYQLDALVFADRLEEFLELPIDYIGAPHMPPYPFGAGNGGLSLRRIDAALRVLEGTAEWVDEHAWYRDRGINEDLFWSFTAPKIDPGFRVADIEAALRFSWEVSPDACYAMSGGELPFGAHGWARHSPEFWEALGGVRALAGIGLAQDVDDLGLARATHQHQ